MSRSPAAETPLDNPTAWESRYRDNRTRWDLGQPSPLLVARWQRAIAADPAPFPTRGRAIVPGCGRGHDALFLAECGYDTVGVDFAPSALAAARDRAASLPERHTARQPLAVEFWERDIFDLATTSRHQFDLWFEHTCLCALHPDRWPDYAALARSCLKPGGHLLGAFFTHGRPGGPPFGCTAADLQRIFEPHFHILALEPAAESTERRQNEEHWGHFQAR